MEVFRVRSTRTVLSRCPSFWEYVCEQRRQPHQPALRHTGMPTRHSVVPLSVHLQVHTEKKPICWWVMMILRLKGGPREGNTGFCGVWWNKVGHYICGTMTQRRKGLDLHPGDYVSHIGPRLSSARTPRLCCYFTCCLSHLPSVWRASTFQFQRYLS